MWPGQYRGICSNAESTERKCYYWRVLPRMVVVYYFGEWIFWFSGTGSRVCFLSQCQSACGYALCHTRKQRPEKPTETWLPPWRLYSTYLATCRLPCAECLCLVPCCFVPRATCNALMPPLKFMIFTQPDRRTDEGNEPAHSNLSWLPLPASTLLASVAASILHGSWIQSGNHDQWEPA